MTPKEAAQYLGSLGGKANTKRKSPAHADKLRVILAAARAKLAKRLADAARIAAVCDTERGATMSARRTIDDHAQRALARDGAARKSARTTHTDGRPAARAGAALTVATRQEPAPSTLEVTP
jgi:hypothetical protein